MRYLKAKILLNLACYCLSFKTLESLKSVQKGKHAPGFNSSTFEEVEQDLLEHCSVDFRVGDGVQ